VILAVGAALLLAGYLLGRLRPWTRLADWAHDQIRYDGAWLTGGRSKQVLLLAAWAATAPRDTYQAFRERKQEQR
jgi:hypothetical protein